METRKEMILTALDAFVRQRSGIDPGNYVNPHDRGDAFAAGVQALRSDQRSITRDLRDYRALRLVVGLRTDITAEDLVAASRGAFSGRLTLTECTHGTSHAATCGKNPKHRWCEACDPAPSALCHWCHGRGYSHATGEVLRLDYCTGQYFPTEYRKAACAVLASALWTRKREDMPQPIGYCVESWMQLGAKRKRSPPLTQAQADDLLEEKGGRQYGSIKELFPDNLSAGEWLRASFRKEFGRGIASRYFS